MKKNKLRELRARQYAEMVQNSTPKKIKKVKDEEVEVVLKKKPTKKANK